MKKHSSFTNSHLLPITFQGNNLRDTFTFSTFIRYFCPKQLTVIQWYFHRLMAVAAMQGANQHIRSNLGFSILPTSFILDCPQTLWHADQGNRTSDLPLTWHWLYLWATAAHTSTFSVFFKGVVGIDMTPKARTGESSDGSDVVIMMNRLKSFCPFRFKIFSNQSALESLAVSVLRSITSSDTIIYSIWNTSRYVSIYSVCLVVCLSVNSSAGSPKDDVADVRGSFNQQ